MACIIKGNDVIPSSGGITPANVSDVNIANGDNCIEIEFKAPENIVLDGATIVENLTLIVAIKKNDIPTVEYYPSIGRYVINFGESLGPFGGASFNKDGEFDDNGTPTELISKSGNLNGGTFKIRLNFDTYSEDILQGTYYIRFFVMSDNELNNESSAIYEYNYILADPVFGNNTWEDINKACELNIIPDTWKIGDEITVTLSGVYNMDVALQIWDFAHYDMSDGKGKNGLVLGCKEIIFIEQMNTTDTNIGGWAESKMHNIVMEDIFVSMPSSLLKVLKTVNIGCDDGYNPETIDDKVFLPSLRETGINESYDKTSGTKFPIFTDNNSRKKINNDTGSVGWWWTRSSYTDYNEHFCHVNGGSRGGILADSDNGVVFCFCI